MLFVVVVFNKELLDYLRLDLNIYSMHGNQAAIIDRQTSEGMSLMEKQWLLHLNY